MRIGFFMLALYKTRQEIKRYRRQRDDKVTKLKEKVEYSKEDLREITREIGPLVELDTTDALEMTTPSVNLVSVKDRLFCK